MAYNQPSGYSKPAFSGDAPLGSTTATSPEDPSKLAGYVNKAMGAVKENVGHAFGATDMEKKGAAQRAMGAAELDAARKQGIVEGQAKQVEGSYKEGYGHTAEQPTTTASGSAERLAGEVQERWNK